MPEPSTFRIAVSDDLLSFIDQRVSTARIPPGIDLPKDKAWSYGIPPSKISLLRDYWEKKYDWRTVEARINSRLKMFTLPIEEAGEKLNMHFVHHRSDRPGAIPLLFQHGWPGNFLEVDGIIDSLVNPEEGLQAYHVVAPSLPGFAFSEGPKRSEFALRNVAAVNHKLMLALGYEKYMAQGGDWGSMVVRIMALEYPDNCVAIHINMIISLPPKWYLNPITFLLLLLYSIYSKFYPTFLTRLLWWMNTENGYMDIQGTKPQTLAYALVDSPIGMLAWMRDKMEPLVGNDFVWNEEMVITWAMMYIIPGTSGHSQIYKNMKDPQKYALLKKTMLSRKLSKKVDFGASVFPKDILNVPHWWAKATISPKIIFWREHTSGGHFPSVEKPGLLIEDIRFFTALIDKKKRGDLGGSGRSAGRKVV